VFANKAPLVLAYNELMGLSREHGGEIKFSATVCGGLPVVNVGCRDLVCSKFSLIEGVFNSTSNFVLSEVAKGMFVCI
jgi:homoserine dehydrogenase